ncbi:hypothetical protein Tco_1172448 [Tanacetum coccineum]
MSWKIAIIHLWNVPGALQRPEGKPPVCERVPYGASEICLFPDHLGRWGFGNNPRNHRENNSIHSPQASRAFGPNEMVKWKVCYSGGFIQHSVVPMHTAILYPIELGINSFCSFSTTLRDVFLDEISVNDANGSADQLRYEWAPPQVTQLCSTAFTGAGAGIGDICLSRSRALTMSFNSATSGDTPEVEVLVLTLANNGSCFGQRGHPMSELIEGVLSQAISGLPIVEKGKSINLIDVLTHVLISKFAALYFRDKIASSVSLVGAWSNSAIVTIISHRINYGRSKDFGGTVVDVVVVVE